MVQASALQPPRVSQDPVRPSLTETLVNEALPNGSPRAKGTGTELGDEKDTQPRVLIIDWDGPRDPTNPRNWSYGRKWAATIIVSAFTFIAPVSSTMIAPAVDQVAEHFHLTRSVIIAMTISIFVLAYALAPFILAPLSEIYGRSRVLQFSNMWYLAWNLACAFAVDTKQLIIFRFMAGLGGSAPLVIGGGIIADCWHAEERGKAVAIYSLTPLLGPVVGPVAGAWIEEKSTWKWVFWSTSIVDAVIQIFGFFFLQETYAPVLLERKANKIIKSMDPEKGPPVIVRTIYQTEDRHWKKIFRDALIRPLILFLREPIVQLLGLYMAFIYGLLYLFLTTMPSIYTTVYHQQQGIAGLHYIALGIGLVGASQLNGYILDPMYKYLKDRHGGVGRPEFRLPTMVPGTILLPIGLLIAGWGTEIRSHWIVTDIGIAFVGAGAIVSFLMITTYVVDAFTLYAASALAAVSCLRSLAGFVFPLFAPAMYKALGFAKGDTLLAGVAILVGCPAPWLFWHYGERIRKRSRYAQG